MFHTSSSRMVIDGRQLGGDIAPPEATRGSLVRYMGGVHHWPQLPRQHYKSTRIQFFRDGSSVECFILKRRQENGKGGGERDSEGRQVENAISQPVPLEPHRAKCSNFVISLNHPHRFITENEHFSTGLSSCCGGRAGPSSILVWYVLQKN